MVLERRKICCICGCRGPNVTDKKASKLWRKSCSYEKDFECCFGAAAEGRTGDLCPTCRTVVAQKYRNNRGLSFCHLLDSKLNLPVGRPISLSVHNYHAAPKTTTNKNAEYVSGDIENLPLVPEIQEPNIPSLENAPSQLVEEGLKIVKLQQKRPRDESPPPRRMQRAKQDVELPVSSNLTCAMPTKHQVVNFLGHYVPSHIITHIMAYLPEADCLSLAFNFVIPSLCKTIQIMESNVAQEKDKLEKLKNVPKEGPLTQSQKVSLQNLITNRENNLDSDGCIVIPQVGSGGKPKRYLKVPKVQMNSRDAAKRTKNQRSQLIEKVEKICATPSRQDIQAQRANNIKRDKQGYAAAAEEAGLKIVARFNKNTVLSLRSIMTLRMWRVLKKVFTDEVGWDVFGSVESMQKELKKMEFNYECGTVTSSTGEVVHFVRVKDINEVVRQMVTELYKANQLIYLDNLEPNCLWLHVSADKGGKSTKLILQVINQQDRHSIDYAKLIGYFEGKDSRFNMEQIFGPLLKSLQECASSISELTLSRPASPASLPPVCSRQHSICDDHIKWTPLIPFDVSNTTISEDCAHCKKCHPTTRRRNDQPDSSEPETDAACHTYDAQLPSTSEPLLHVVSQVMPSQELEPQINPNSEGSPVVESNLSLCHVNATQLPKTPQVNARPQLAPPLHTPANYENCDQSSSMCTSGLQAGSLHPCDAATPQRSMNDDGRPMPRNLFPSHTCSSPAAKDVPHKSDDQCVIGEVYTTCQLTVGGDWEGSAKLLGLSGPNGKQFCNHCLVTLDQVPRSIPHAAHILPKYQQHTNGDEFVVSSEECFLRSFEGCKDKHKEFQAAGSKAKALDYENCEHEPMLSGGKVIDTFSTTPLHISLGIGLHVLNVVEHEAVKLDKKIKNDEGKYDAFSLALEHKKEILAACQTVKDKIESVDDNISEVIEKKKEIIKDRASFFKTNRGKYVNNSELAKGVRERFANLDKEKASLIKDKEKLEKQLKTQETKLTKVLVELDKIKGPFKAGLDDVLNSMKLQRVAYHSGALVGPDVKKLVTKKNITAIGKVFKPMKLLKENGTFQVYGTHELSVKIVTLLSKFKQCYDLYTANRPLCRHEVEILAMRCCSLGCWFPINFPEENLKRKFHLLTVDVPKQARRIRTVGMITEQTIESIHPYINELDRRFAKVADKKQKGLIIMKQQNMYSQPNWNALKKRKGKKGKR